MFFFKKINAGNEEPEENEKDYSICSKEEKENSPLTKIKNSLYDIDTLNMITIVRLAHAPKGNKKNIKCVKNIYFKMGKFRKNATKKNRSAFKIFQSGELICF